MIKVAKCLSDDYIHSYRLKNFCYEHKMPVSEIKSDLLSQSYNSPIQIALYSCMTKHLVEGIAHIYFA